MGLRIRQERTTNTSSAGGDEMSNRHVVLADRLTRTTLAGTMLVTGVAAAVAWPWDIAAAKGIFVGGFAGALGFWMIARRARVLTSIPKEEIPFRVYRWTFSRMFIYASALFFAYLIDPSGRHALLGAAGGLFIARVVLLFAAVTEWRRRDGAGVNPPAGRG